MTSYYNEVDKHAAAWLRELVKAGHIADGIVDERDIQDVLPSDLAGFTQCHFFAGIGVWSYALGLAGWPDDQPVWTGSCPCQPFSAAGKGAGFDDERHLWPAFNHLIEQCRPPIVFGEQVASKAVEPWIDLVHADLEALGYAFGCVPFPSAGVGAPHIRDRAYWVANADSEGGHDGRRVHRGCIEKSSGAEKAVRGKLWHEIEGNRIAGWLADAILQQRPDGQPGLSLVNDPLGRIESAAAPAGLCHDLRPGPVNGFWRDADWLGCRDGKWRPVEPGSFPLVDGAAARVVRLRGYGNAVNAVQAQAFIEAFMGYQQQVSA